ncbi:hypothetical protein [Halorientalis halophila]|uniref:hypothetical protein n=1 Tax=Halorientalis halophila TaxID=3108499 RepID=UPI00300B11FD
MSGHETDAATGLSDRTKIALALSAGVVLPGLANYGLGRAGYPTLGSLVWVVGYFGVMIAIWYVWVRPLDLTGPAE